MKPFELSKRHRQELVEAREVFDLVIAVVLGNATTKSSHGKKVHDLRKDEFAPMHDETSQGIGKASLFEIKR